MSSLWHCERCHCVWIWCTVPYVTIKTPISLVAKGQRVEPRGDPASAAAALTALCHTEPTPLGPTPTPLEPTPTEPLYMGTHTQTHTDTTTVYGRAHTHKHTHTTTVYGHTSPSILQLSHTLYLVAIQHLHQHTQ